jgi:uncharacterized protein (TIGR03067 family)
MRSLDMPVSTAVAVQPRVELEPLQGIWTTVAGPRQAKLLVAGNRFTFEFLDGDVYMGTFELDGAAEPRRMDMRIEEGPDKHRGQVALCIYHVDGGVLRWCPARIGADQRLSCFPCVDDERYLSLVFKQLRPGRR